MLLRNPTDRGSFLLHKEGKGIAVICSIVYNKNVDVLLNSTRG